MKKVNTYICELCFAKFLSEEEAIAHESTHWKINRIVSKSYDSKNSKAPDEIVVEFDNE